jgi:hypothetical protein
MDLSDELKDRGAALVNNEMRFDNFVNQALKLRIVTKKSPECKREKDSSWMDWFNGTSQLETLDEKNYLINVVYLNMFDYLVKKRVINQKVGLFSFLFVFDYIYTINKELIGVEKLRELLNPNAPDFPKSLKCYDINYPLLSNFLTNYKYNPADTFEIVGEAVAANPKPNQPQVIKPQGQSGGMNKKRSAKNKKSMKKRRLITRKHNNK